MLDVTTLAAWGEFIGGIAVVVSLIYLASQIRQNTRLLQMSAADAATRTAQSISMLQLQDAEVARIFREGMAQRDDLSEGDLSRFDSSMSVLLAGFAQQYEYERCGLAGIGTWEQQKLQMRYVFRRPGAQQWWRDWRETCPAQFRNYVDGLVREAEAAK